MLDLKGMQILIVEDEFVLAQDMARQFEDAGATVLGPSSTVEQALAHVQTADAAILDVNLNGELVYPIADALAQRRVPFVFFTGYADPGVPGRFHFVRVMRKPVSPANLAKELFGRPAGKAETLLPGLRVAARMRISDPDLADMLVEEALQRAIAGIAERPKDVSLEDWLHELLDELDACDQERRG